MLEMQRQKMVSKQMKRLVILMQVPALLALSACVGSPTYGTGKTANAQLMEDFSSAISLAPKKPPNIAYQPRPELVKTGATAALFEPQDKASKQDGVWPESPEQKRARLRQIATDAQGDANFVPVIVNDLPTGNLTSAAVVGKTPAQISQEAKERKALNASGSSTVRSRLSEPPIEYRKPVETATYGELGEDESKKERRLRSESKKKSGKGGIKSLIPWL